MKRRSKILLALVCVIVGISFLKDYLTRPKPPYYLDDVSRLDGPYEFVKVNDEGVLSLKKNDNEYQFELLGLLKDEHLKGAVNIALEPGWLVWIDYDAEKYSSAGNLQGYVYYRYHAVHDIPTGAVYDQEYRMVNPYILGRANIDITNAGHKYFQFLLNEAIERYQYRINRRKKGLADPKGTIWEGRSTAELESKLAQYKKCWKDVHCNT